MKHALVTGSEGFVGRHFAWWLAAHGWSVCGMDTMAKGFERRDCREFFLHDLPSKLRPWDLVIHCAAIVGGRKVIDGNPLALASNLELDAGLFQWALRARPRRVVYFSSSAGYPAYLQAGWAEHKLKESDLDPAFASDILGTPDQLYGWAKVTGENLAHRYRQEGGNVTVVRPFSGYGEDQDDTYPFPKFIDRALHRDNPFQIWGDGNQTRDFIHIDDIVECTMKMTEEDIDGPVNLGWGRATSMKELAKMVCRAEDYQPEFEFQKAEPSGVGYRVCDNTLMKEIYAPRITLEEGIERAWVYRSAR